MVNVQVFSIATVILNNQVNQTQINRSNNNKLFLIGIFK